MQYFNQLPPAAATPGGAALSQQEIDAARALLRARTEGERQVASGTRVHRYGEPGEGFHHVEEGLVRMTRTTGAGQEILIHVGTAGFWFGLLEVRSLGGVMKPLDVTAATDARIATVPAPVMETLLEENPLVRRYFMAKLTSRYAILLDMVETGLKTRPVARLATRLLAFARTNCSPGVLPPTLDVPLGQATLSELTGVSRQTVNRALRALSRDGIIEPWYGGLRIVDFEGLALAAETGLKAGEDR